MTDSINRLKQLYTTLGLNVADSTINRAEIAGYCSAINFVLDQLVVNIDREHVGMAVEYNADNYALYASDHVGSFAVSGNVVTFSNASVDHIGTLFEEWFCPFHIPVLNGSGVMWRDQDLKWRKLDARNLRWSMIDTLGG